MSRIRPGVTPPQIHGRGEGGDGAGRSRGPSSRSRPTRRRRARWSRRGGGVFSHTVGMAVHDVGSYRDGPLKPGQVFSVDPQLRVPEENLYLRYEDTVVVTETGVENFTDFLPWSSTTWKGSFRRRASCRKCRQSRRRRFRESSDGILHHNSGSNLMDLLQLEHFLAVVEERTFTRAAERVCRTQPAVSQSIKKLEEEVGAPLFARDVHEVSLTEAGRVLADYARRMVQLRDEALRQVTELNAQGRDVGDRGARVCRGLSAAGAAPRYLQKFPDIKVGIYRSRAATRFRARCMDREVDVGFVKDEPAFHELQWVEVHSDEMVCIVSPRHIAGVEADVRVRDLGSEQFVLHHLCSTTAEPSCDSSIRTGPGAGLSPSCGASRTSRASSRKKSAWRSSRASPSGRNCVTAASCGFLSASCRCLAER